MLGSSGSVDKLLGRLHGYLQDSVFLVYFFCCLKNEPTNDDNNSRVRRSVAVRELRERSASVSSHIIALCLKKKEEGFV